MICLRVPVAILATISKTLYLLSKVPSKETNIIDGFIYLFITLIYVDSFQARASVNKTLKLSWYFFNRNKVLHLFEVAAWALFMLQGEVYIAQGEPIIAAAVVETL